MVIRLPQTDPSVFKLLLQFVYSGPAGLSKHFTAEADASKQFVSPLFSLIDLADSFDMPELSGSILELIGRLAERMWQLMSGDQKKVPNETPRATHTAACCELIGADWCC